MKFRKKTSQESLALIPYHAPKENKTLYRLSALVNYLFFFLIVWLCIVVLLQSDLAQSEHYRFYQLQQSMDQQSKALSELTIKNKYLQDELEYTYDRIIELRTEQIQSLEDYAVLSVKTNNLLLENKKQRKKLETLGVRIVSYPSNSFTIAEDSKLLGCSSGIKVSGTTLLLPKSLSQSEFAILQESGNDEQDYNIVIYYFESDSRSFP